MPKESSKHKTTIKKSNALPNMDFEAFLKNQQNILSKLKNQLKSAISEVHLSHCGTAEKEKCLLELEHSINQREAEIQKLRVNLNNLKEENSHILLEFNFFKEKFYQLETEYDRALSQQKQDNESLLQQLQEQQTMENQELQKISLKCEDLQRKLQDKMNDFNQLNKLYEETLQTIQQTKISFEQQQKEFELYKIEVNQERRLNEEKFKIDFNNLQDELKQKDEILKKSIADKNLLEKEKNAVIDELNNKIQRIERAFSQPTKAVQPMVTLPQKQKANSLDNNSNSEIYSSNDNLAISKPHLRNPLENLSNKENQQQSKQNQTQQRAYKFARPIQPATSSQQSNVVTNRKRRNQPFRQSSAKKTCTEFSLSSSDEDDDDDDSNYNSFSQQLWRPNKDCYVADTDASEGFAKSKRIKK